MPWALELRGVGGQALVTRDAGFAWHCCSEHARRSAPSRRDSHGINPFGVTCETSLSLCEL